MAFLLCWLVLPLLLGGLSLGVGLLVEWVGGGHVPGALVIPLGLAGTVVAAQAATATDATAELAAPLVVGLALVGLALAARSRRPLLDLPALLPTAGVYAVFAAPAMLSGRTTFAGYIKLDDTATFLALTDRVMEHGRSLAGLAPSTYEATLAVNLAHGYPLGSFLPLGVGSRILGQDPAWLFQPTVAFLAAVLSLGLWALAAPLVPGRLVRALAVFVAAQPALLYGYSLWGGIKEVCAAALVPLVAALAVSLVRGAGGWRSAFPPAVAIAAVLATLSLGGAAWLVPALVFAAVGAWPRRRALAPVALPLAAAVVVLALPTLVDAREFLRDANAQSLTSGAELGNLVRPLSPLQLLGIWPAADFRLEPRHQSVTYLLLAVLVAAAAVGLLAAWRRRAWALLLYAGGTVLACDAILVAGSPWVDAKALATASPCLLLLALVGTSGSASGSGLAAQRRTPASAAGDPAAAARPVRAKYTAERGYSMLRRKMRPPRYGPAAAAALATVLLAGGVAWSNALAYHDANLAPADRLRELQRIGERFAGEGPALMTEYEPYGARHFLRRLDAEGASELRRRPVLLVDAGELPKGGFADVDAIRLDGLLVYRTLVLQRSPVASRPPSVYRLAWRGRFYDVWQRPADTASPIVRHVPLGTASAAAAVPPCRDLVRLGASTARGNLLAAAPARTATLAGLDTFARPRGWPAAADPGSVLPLSDGDARGVVSVPRSGRFELWVGGSVKGRLEAFVDGARAGSARDELNPSGQYVSLGRIALDRGSHRIVLRYHVQALRPGEGGPPPPLGPLALSPVVTGSEVAFLSPARARSFCGRPLDWIEEIAGPRR